MKYGKVLTAIIKPEQLEYIKLQIDRNIKTTLACNQHKKAKVEKLKNIRNKIEHEIPLDEDEIRELNQMV